MCKIAQNTFNKLFEAVALVSPRRGWKPFEQQNKELLLKKKKLEIQKC